jgi:hypothetical protein
MNNQEIEQVARKVVRDLEDRWEMGGLSDSMYEDLAAETAVLVASVLRERHASLCENMGMKGFGTLAIAAAIRKGEDDEMV